MLWVLLELLKTHDSDLCVYMATGLLGFNSQSKMIQILDIVEIFLKHIVLSL